MWQMRHFCISMFVICLILFSYIFVWNGIESGKEKKKSKNKISISFLYFNLFLKYLISFFVLFLFLFLSETNFNCSIRSNQLQFIKLQKQISFPFSRAINLLSIHLYRTTNNWANIQHFLNQFGIEINQRTRTHQYMEGR
jgi:hypothetical protein